MPPTLEMTKKTCGGNVASFFSIFGHLLHCLVCIIYQEKFKCLSDVQWKLVNPNYLKSFTAQNAVASWRAFLLKLGVRDKIAVTSLTERVPEVNYST